MSTRLEVATEVGAPLERVWDELVDWYGQARWIPLTTLRVLSARDAGLGVRVTALSGFWLGRLPAGLLDRFVVTGWSPPADGVAELEVLHLGPCFTGEGVFRLTADGGRTRVRAVELFTVPGGPLPNRLVGLALPLMRLGLGWSLRRLAAVAEVPRAERRA
ncbi:Polyketide cyclase / dehydrase and lipid transport [Friedmanniella luteola]|uniref:Polyketide cyclase / dehydrase and lipid transport n=1 Tax=Friedmanniella luteola TaxID=546871 RepID=A0A1H1NHC0_9ACTN|nr:SRPBCC family protein [Friedmanniella luteola]SDR98364.1 Polyketide cyclase / dehydrase and lipid transport [Friedmanniella luteola]